MKATLFLLAFAASAIADQPMFDSISDEALAEKQRANPLADLARPTDIDVPRTHQEPQSIIKQSAILNDGKHWTLVPKGAVLHLPEALQAKVNAKPVGVLLTWQDFLARNQNWVSTAEVNFEQASGKTPIAEEKTEFWAKQGKVIVAVHLGGPISVIAPKPDPAVTQR